MLCRQWRAQAAAVSFALSASGTSRNTDSGDWQALAGLTLRYWATGTTLVGVRVEIRR